MRESLRQGDPCVHNRGLRIATAMPPSRRTRSHQRLREGSSMGQKTVRFSDLSGQLIMHDDALARIVVHEHPELGDGPVEIEALTEEAGAIEESGLRVAVLDLYLPDDTEKRLVNEHLDEINERLAAQGLRTISLTDPEHVERYGLQDLAQNRKLELEFGLVGEAGVDAKVA